VLENLRTGKVVSARLITAFDSRARRTGLLGRAVFDDAAMIIAPTQAIHTCFMRFPIDVVFVARDGRVVKTRRALRPWRCAAAWRAHAAIELPAGTLQNCDIEVGDLLAITVR
jgi:uncharacterized membrane protein (UPF0127 family)